MRYIYVLLVSFLLIAIVVPLQGCMPASKHHEQLASTQERETTVGIVQRDIRKGMDQPAVAAALGSPNIVTRDKAGHETWIYDKIASEASYSRDSGGTGLILSLIGIYSKEAGAVSTTQRTLTVIIKFDDNQLVDTFSYHASKF